MNNGLLILCFCCSVFSGILILLLTSYYCKLKDRVDDLQYRLGCLQSKYDNHRYIVIKNISELSSKIDVVEKQIANISKTSAEFFCATNNRIADISTVVDSLDFDYDELFDKVTKVDKKLDSSIKLFSFCHLVSEKRYFHNKERLDKLYDSPHLGFFSKRRDKNG